jgi:trehalose 6-phosphate phosphatase
LRDASPPESSRDADAPLSRALALSREALAAEPAGLLTDFDGTLSPIVRDPMSARLVDGATDALAMLARRLAVVAVITGRAPLDARRMTGVPELLVAGNHGTEWLEPGADAPTASPDAARVRDLLDELLGWLPPLDGVTVEHKGLSATVHYRGAADPESTRVAILGALGDPGPDIELRPGRMSIELRPTGLGDKGVAARRVIERHGLRGVVVMGDDVTDLDMFRAVRELREAGSLRGVVVGVGGADGEVPAEVAAAADVVIGSPEEAATFIAGLASTD